MKVVLANALLVGMGGFAGAVLRYGLSGFVHRQFPPTLFPIGTIAVNLAGCLAIGAFFGLTEARQLFGPELRVFALVGLLSGFTTFSAFGFETFALIRDGEALLAGVNVGMQVVGGLVCVWLGYLLTTSG